MLSRAGTVLACALAGGLAGLAVFGVSHLNGAPLYIALGAAIAVATLWLRQFRSTARLSQIKVMVPRIAEWTFVVDEAARRTAWSLFVETATRVSTQPVNDGLIREALTSLHGLFETTRGVLCESRPSVPVAGERTVEHLAVTMLNHELRPFLSKWHHRLSAYERTSPGASELDWHDYTECHHELREVQQSLIHYAHAYARLAEVHNAEPMLTQTP